MKPIRTSILNLARVVALPLAGLALALPASAQNKANEPLEEIVVISSKIKGSVDIMDEPTSVTAITGADIEQSGIKDVVDLQQSVPGLIVGRSQTQTTSNFAIRGIGSTSNNFGVESSVGLYVDGVYRSRQSSMINELVDVASVEVWRGPQGTLFGKNTAAGAIQASTDAVEGFLELTAGDRNLQRIAGAINVPLSDKLAFRGTVFSSQRDGFVDNYVYDLMSPVPSVVVQDDAFNDRDRYGLRMQLGYDNGSDFTMRIIGDYSKVDEVCCIGTSRVDGLLAHDILEATGVGVPGPDFLRMALGTIVFTDYPYGDVLPTAAVLGYDVPTPPNVITGVSWDDYITSVNYAPLSQNEDRGLSLEFNKDFENARLTSVTAWRSFDTNDFIDVDFTDTDFGIRTNDASQESISQELRLSGSFGDSSNWVVGAYYFAQEIRSNTRTEAGSQLQAFVDLGQEALGEPTLSDITNAVTAISQGLALAGIPFPEGAEGFPEGTFADDDVKQEHDGYAVFGQVDWSFTDAWMLSLGARYTDETKDIDAVYTQTNPGTAPPDLTAIGTSIFLFQQWVAGGQVGPPPDLTPLLAVAEPNVGWAAWTLAPFSPRPNVQETLKDDQVTGTAKLTWYPNEDTMAYVSYSTGFKSGGTNTDRIWFYLPQLFNAEKSKSMELGFKGNLGDNLTLAAAIYKTDFEDFQANTFTGTGFYLQNAGDLEIKGIELEWNWTPTDNLSIGGYYAHNQGQYNTFRQGTCWDATPFHTGQDDPGRSPPPPGADPNEQPCDRSGTDLPYNPEDRYNVTVTQNFPMGMNNMFIRAEYTWLSEQYTDGDSDPLTLQDGFGILNLRLGVDIDDWNSTITLWGRNVLDERYYGGSFDPPLLDFGRMNSYPSEPATWGITFRKNWD
jgi:outer membrane receptor protein involved in Fe transport